ncbi:MAG TPA: hypothetical protein PK101_00340, partial [Thauera sp.]|nr:hypothetical protein [Thauera sp.]
MTTVAVALAIAGGAGYWLARVQHGAAPATPVAVAAAAPVAGAAAEAAGGGSGEDSGRGSRGGSREGSGVGPADDSRGGERQILYYRNPMGLPDTSPVPKKDSMG